MDRTYYQEAVDAKALETAARAEAKIDAHEDICAIRYQGIENSVKQMSAAVENQSKETRDNFKQLYGRLWVIVGGSFLVATTIIGVLFVKAYG